MNPHSRLSWTLGCALMIWAPVAFSAVTGRMDFAIAGLYFLGAIFLAYIGVGIIGAIADGYRQTHDRAERVKMEIQRIEQRNAAADQSKSRRRKSEGKSEEKSEE